MTTKHEAPALIVSLLITVTLLSGGVWWSAGRLHLDHMLSLDPVSLGRSRHRFPDLADRLSQGERLLIEIGAVPEKQAGVRAIATGNPTAAIPNLEAALAVNPNDPEARIYLSNARIGHASAYTLAVVVPSGRDLLSALEILRGAAQAQQEVNQSGGINGVPLRLMLVNDDEDAAIAQRLAEVLGRDANVLGVVGPNSSETVEASAPHFEAAGLVSISPLNSTTTLGAGGGDRYRTIPTDFVSARALSDHLLNHLHQQKAVLFYSSNQVASRSLRDELSTALALGGGQLLQDYDLAGAGFNPVESVNQAALQGATALILLPAAEHLDRALQVVQVNRGRLSLLAGNPLYSAKTLEIAGPEAVGMVMAVPWHMLSDPDAVFAQSSRQLWQADVNWRTAMTYDAMQAFVAALRQHPTRTGIAASLRQPDFFAMGATGVVRFLPTGDRNQSIQLVQVQPGFRSGLGYDFVPVGFAPILAEPNSLGLGPQQ